MLITVLFAALASASFASDCDKLRVPLCANMPYREIRLPNLFGHKIQDEVNQALEPLAALRESQCFDDHSLVICSALAPPCLPGEPVTPAPCRSACQRAYDECYDLLLVLNITEAFPDCARLPDERTDPYCVIPAPSAEPTYFKRPYKELSDGYQDYGEYDVLGSAPGRHTSHNELSQGPWYPRRPVEHLPSFPITHKPNFGPRPAVEKRVRRSPAHKIVPRQTRSRTRSRSRSRSRTRIRANL